MKFALPLTTRVRAISLGVLVMLAVCPHANATIRTVTNPTDHIIKGLLSLRQAIAASATGDTINFALPAGTVIPLEQELVINLGLFIVGPGADQLTIGRDEEQNPSSRIFNFQSEASVTMSGLTIADGNLNVSTGSENSGGGILNQGRLAMGDCAVSGNQNSVSGGGGISNTGSMDLARCTISGNAARQVGAVSNFGGGIANRGTLSVTNCTISGNLVAGTGGGIYNSITATIDSSTIANNQANPVSGTAGGGGIVNGNPTGAIATLTMMNTIVADNRSTGTGPDYLGTITSRGYNLIGNTTNTVITGVTTGNLLNISPKLGSLQNNGGPTKTLALLTGSPAIDKGKVVRLSTDQRGFPRPEDYPSIPNAPGGDSSDIGAYEVSLIEIVSITRLSNAHILLICKGVPNFAHHIEASPDLIAPFASIAAVTADSNGDFQFEDPNAGSFEQRFYRLTFP
jgi:hypothetical protein